MVIITNTKLLNLYGALRLFSRLRAPVAVRFEALRWCGAAKAEVDALREVLQTAGEAETKDLLAKPSRVQPPELKIALKDLPDDTPGEALEELMPFITA